MVANPALPNPATWTANEYVTVPRLRADVSNAVAFFLQRPFFNGQNNTGQGWSSGADSNLGLQSELSDTWNMHSTAQNTSMLYCQVPGWYLCRNTTPFNYTSTTQNVFATGFNWVNNGVTQTAIRGPLTLIGMGHAPSIQCCDLIQQTVTGSIGGSGDFIQPTAFQNTGSSVNLLTGARLPTVSVRWVCANSGTQPLAVPPNATVPSPITSAWLNANIRDAIRFLAYPPIGKAIYTPGSSSLASQAFPAGTAVPVNTVTVDNYGGFTTGTQAEYTAPVAGSYYCYGQFSLTASTATTGYGAGFSVNGGTTAWGDVIYKVSDTTGGGAQITKRLRLNAGDTVQLMANQGSGSTITYNGSAPNQTRFIVVWDGA